ncbi:zinc-dependent metalloprotease [Aestuariimicrobium ganziense]|uniref:zinc-dependent metalloprotease n=1 Tax=Aestuariimicrobium ganziense TaxID=2773677 RepID=UPI00194239E5|nr:zinc-dependent metalloprotease [Aestuariimicrobium ganziense]
MNDTPDHDPRPGDQPEGDPVDPFRQLFEQMGMGNGDQPLDLNALMAQVQRLLGGSGLLGGAAGMGGAGSATGSPIDWTQARVATRHLSAARGSDPSPTPSQQRGLADAARLAELWLDEACEFPAVTATPQVWSRAEWIEQTLDSWKPIVEPIVTSLGDAMAGLLATDGHEDDPMAAMATMFVPMLRQMAGGMYTMQFSQALAELSGQVVSGTEIGIQLLSRPRVTLMQSNIDTHFADLDLPSDDIRLYLTLREAARQRLFSAVGWLAPQLLALVEHYAHETRIDRDVIESTIAMDDIGSLTPERLQELSQQLQGKLFEPTQTDEQRAVLQRLETLLALTEGWVDHVVAVAATRWMPNHAALAETLRRRRGVGGPAEKVFQALVGLELRPRRVRDAQNLWAAIDAERGAVARDGLWSHPDLLPSASALDDPMGYVVGEAEGGDQAADESLDDLDRELAKLLEQEGREQD